MQFYQTVLVSDTVMRTGFIHCCISSIDTNLIDLLKER